MARTRGAGSRLEGRTRPTTSVRRGYQGASSSTPPVGGQAPRIGGDDAGEVVSFPGGSFDVSLLLSHNHHVAFRLW